MYSSHTVHGYAGLFLASCSGDRTVRIWERLSDPRPPWWYCCTVLEDTHTKTIRSVNWSPGGDSLVTASFDGSTVVWRKTSSGWAQVRRFCGVCRCTVLHLGTAVGSRLRAPTVYITGWSSFSDKCGPVSVTHFVTVRIRSSYGAWSPCSLRLITEFLQVAILEGHENEVKCAVFSPCSSLLATCGRDKTVWIWESFPGDDFECVDVKQGHTQDVKMVSWQPGDKKVLVSVSYDNSIKVWMEDPDGSEWCVV